MTIAPQQIDEMQAGPELDRLVAELVMGWSKTTDPDCFTSENGIYECLNCGLKEKAGY